MNKLGITLLLILSIVVNTVFAFEIPGAAVKLSGQEFYKSLVLYCTGMSLGTIETINKIIVEKFNMPQTQKQQSKDDSTKTADTSSNNLIFTKSQELTKSAGNRLFLNLYKTDALNCKDNSAIAANAGHLKNILFIFCILILFCIMFFAKARSSIDAYTNIKQYRFRKTSFMLSWFFYLSGPKAGIRGM